MAARSTTPGHIVKRGGGSYSVVVDLGRDPATGKRRQRWVTVKGNKRDAEHKLMELLRERELGLDFAASKVTLEEYLKRWLRDYAAPNTRPKTYERYEQIVRLNLIPRLGTVPLQKLQPLQIQACYKELRESGRTIGKGGLSAQSVKHVHRVLSEALAQAVRWDLLARNPADAVKPPRVERREMQVLDVEEARRLVNVSEEHDPDYGALVYVALATGLRLGELLALRWTDIDVERERLQVVRTVQRVQGKGLLFGEPKTGGSRRPVALSSEMLGVLREHRSRQNERRLALGPAYSDHGLIFPNPLGEPVAQFQASRRFKRFVELADVKKPIRFHDLRHTNATLLGLGGFGPKIIAERLGHSSTNLTLNIYSHVLPDMGREAANYLGRVLGE